jgi:hypothetical protein
LHNNGVIDGNIASTTGHTSYRAWPFWYSVIANWY